MTRNTNSFAALVFLLASAPLMFSQALQSKPTPALPSDIVGPQLVAWSQVQKPQPLAESSQAAQTGNSETQGAPKQAPAAQTFMGTIVKDGDRYILKVASNAYQLDDQERAGKYEGKQVKISGNLDTDGNSLHILSIELIS